jgi:hypothetical protein
MKDGGSKITKSILFVLFITISRCSIAGELFEKQRDYRHNTRELTERIESLMSLMGTCCDVAANNEKLISKHSKLSEATKKLNAQMKEMYADWQQIEVPFPYEATDSVFGLALESLLSASQEFSHFIGDFDMKARTKTLEYLAEATGYFKQAAKERQIAEQKTE